MKIQKLLIIFALVASLTVGTYSVQVFGQQNNPVENKQYIVVFRDGISDANTAAQKIASTHGLGLLHQYNHALKGFSATISSAKLDAVRRDPRVEFISEDRIVYASGQSGQQVTAQAAQIIPTGVSRIGAPSNANKGAGVSVAVIDTGIDLSHPDLVANIASVNKSCILGTKNANDDNGHGTHVAGTIAATNNSIGVVGVAPGAKLVAVKVLNRNGSGTWSSVICGIDWVTANAASYGIKVANMSLGGAGASDNNCGNTNSDALHKAICNSTAKGVTYVVAAGNNNANTANSVPAAYDDTVITVSALADSDGVSGGFGSATSYGADDTFATFSNFGAAVDLGAPGVNIFSTWKKGTYNTISGTSMATPHVSGAAALYIASHPGSLWIQVRDALKAAGEPLNYGHTDPSGRHPEPVALAGTL